jgi:hypothetical protein
VQETILHDSYHEYDMHGNGGNRRTLQIVELVQSAGILTEKTKKAQATRFSKYLAGFIFLVRHPAQMTLSYRAIGCHGNQYLNYQNIFKNHSGRKIIIWESTVDYLASGLAREAGYKILALPQNLESLVLSHTELSNRKSLLGRFENEVTSLATSDAVFCISREEQWLLKLYGINADFLPYYPPKKILTNLLNLRDLRQSSLKTKFLIVGTALNPPTLLGMIEQLQWLEEIRKEIDFEVDIAGYGTEQLQKYCSHPSFNLLGPIETEKLEHLMLSAKAVLVHQKAGVGALTRIPEMVVAGIPVIVNSNACRSAFSYAGVHCYDSQTELLELMSKSLSTPDLLPRPVNDEKRFINCLRLLME